jgi:hypothetical protein
VGSNPTPRTILAVNLIKQVLSMLVKSYAKADSFKNGNYQGTHRLHLFTNLKMLEDWKKRSNASSTSLSKFVIDRVEDFIYKGEGGYLSRLDLVKRTL